MDAKTVGAIIFIVMIIGANLFMYGLVRAWAQPGKRDFLQTLGDSFNAARKKEDSLDELHRKMEELKQGQKSGSDESET